jgi:hypothetical protein
MLKIRAGINPLTLKPGTIEEAIRIRVVLMTKVNKPRVRIFIGRVKIIRIGFKKAFRMPKTTETIMAIQKDSTLTPGVI